jgi:hypothetical protein
MEILFTKSDLILSKMIRHISEEPVSHCAIAHDWWVAHSSVFGVEIMTREEFESRYTIVYSVPRPDIPEQTVLQILTKTNRSMYDYGCLLYLGVRWTMKKYFKIPLPKVNLWASSGMYMCTEWLTAIDRQGEDSMITPYKLYLKMSGQL